MKLFFHVKMDGCLQCTVEESMSFVGTIAACLDMFGCMPGTRYLCTMFGHVRGPKTIRS